MRYKIYLKGDITPDNSEHVCGDCSRGVLRGQVCTEGCIERSD